MQKFDILDPSVNIFQSRFLEASAGTGKTFAIEHLFVRLLLESEPSIGLPEVLAVTFTREAAQEMKGRIRSKLTSLCEEGDPRVTRALALFDEVQVLTIHGFCHRMLSDYAFEAGVPLTLCSPDQPDHLHEMRRTVEDFFQTADPAFSKEITALTGLHRFDLNRLIEQILRAMQESVAAKPLAFPKLPAISHEELIHDIPLLLPRFKRVKEQMWQEQATDFIAYLRSSDSALLTENSEWFFEKMVETNAKVRAKPLSCIPLKNPHFFHALQDALIPALATFRDKEQMLRRVAAECRRRWECKAQRRDHLTFDDLLHQMKSALDIPAFKSQVQSRYKVVIIDEFQDTDPVQWSIFRGLFLDSHLVYLVGDPKQSIYGFRSADIYTYMRAAKDLGKGSGAHLDTNFRSSPLLVKALNTLFTKRPNWLELPSLPGALCYHRVKAGRTEGVLDESPVVLFGAKGEIGRERSFPTKALEQERLFPYIASEILRLCDQIPFGQMAVLITDRFHAQRLQLYLNQWNIPSTIKRTFNLAESRGFAEMKLLLAALRDPFRQGSVKAALRGEGENPFHQLRTLFDTRGFTACFRKYLEEHFNCHGDSALRSELIQTAELLMHSDKKTPAQLLRMMEELQGESPEIDPRLKLRSDEEQSQVAIMTTFASKGLEFDVVFALDVAYRRSQELSAEQRAEQMRKLYVAFTRPREKLYIPYVIETSGKGKWLSPSAIEQFFETEPQGIEWIEQTPSHSYSSCEKGALLVAPPKVELNFDRPFLTSFSSMAKPHVSTLLSTRFKAQNLGEKTPHTLPLGAETGTVIHELFERHFSDRKRPIDELTFEGLSGTHLEGWEEVVCDMIKKTLCLELASGFSLCDLRVEECYPEMEFLFPREDHFVKGFIDLIFRRGDTFFIVDWKTNWVGSESSAYTQEALQLVMREHDYYLQAQLYKEALMRYVKRLYKNPLYGGAYYVFVRGNQAVYIGTS